MSQTIDVGRFRSGVANLLADVVNESSEIERTLSEGQPIRVLLDEVQGIQRPASPSREDADRFQRIECALFLHKARIHLNAVLRADEAGNLHSLGVQMRPVMECAGQVVFIIGTLEVPHPEMGHDGAFEKVDEYLHADLYRTAIGSTRGRFGHDDLVEMFQSVEDELAASIGTPRSGSRARRSLRQEDKVAMLPGGKAVYAYLSEHFCHGETSGDGATLRDNVDIRTQEHELRRAHLMFWLVEYVALMNAHASLCSVPGTTATKRMDAALARIAQVREAMAEIVSQGREAGPA